MRTVVLASANAKKVAELRRLVAEAELDVQVLGLADVDPYPEPAETERTFVHNALLKARACVAATGQPALADDSGLRVDELNQMPGVRSARWAGPQCDDGDNLRLVLAQLHDVPAPRRGAEFVCALAFAAPNGTTDVVEGVMRGHITEAPRGEHGFGYDPIFCPDGFTKTTAQMSPEQKDEISHRALAVRAMATKLPGLLEGSDA